MTASRPTMHRLDSRDAWLAARRIGSSDVAAILGLSHYDDHTEWDVFERLVKGPRDRRPNRYQRRGRRKEPEVLARYVAEVGADDLRVPRPHTLWTRDAWASATPDARRPRLVVEVKTDALRHRWGEPTTIERWEPWCHGVVRLDYYHQLHHQLFVLDEPAGDLAVLLPSDDPFDDPELRVYRILRDRQFEERVVEHLRGWWERHVVGREPPEWDGSAAASRCLADLERQGSRTATGPELQLAAAYETARRTAKEWDAYRRRVGQLLVAAAGTKRELTLPHGRVTVVTNRGRPSLDEQGLLEMHPELAELFTAFTLEGEPYSYPRITGLEAA